MEKRNNLVTIIDNDNRMYLAESIGSFDHEERVKNPVAVSYDQRDGNVSIMLVPIIFEEFLSDVAKKEGVVFDFSRDKIKWIGYAIDFNEDLIKTYDKIVNFKHE